MCWINNLKSTCKAGRRAPPVTEAVGGGIPVTPEEQEAANQVANQEESETVPRPETFEISHEPSDRTDDSVDDEREAEEAQNAANVQADNTIIQNIRQVWDLIKMLGMNDMEFDGLEMQLFVCSTCHTHDAAFLLLVTSWELFFARQSTNTVWNRNSLLAEQLWTRTDQVQSASHHAHCKAKVLLCQESKVQKRPHSVSFHHIKKDNTGLRMLEAIMCSSA